MIRKLISQNFESRKKKKCEINGIFFDFSNIMYIYFSRWCAQHIVNKQG